MVIKKSKYLNSKSMVYYFYITLVVLLDRLGSGIEVNWYICILYKDCLMNFLKSPTKTRWCIICLFNLFSEQSDSYVESTS